MHFLEHPANTVMYFLEYLVNTGLHFLEHPVNTGLHFPEHPVNTVMHFLEHPVNTCLHFLEHPGLYFLEHHVRCAVNFLEHPPGPDTAMHFMSVIYDLHWRVYTQCCLYFYYPFFSLVFIAKRVLVKYMFLAVLCFLNYRSI